MFLLALGILQLMRITSTHQLNNPSKFTVEDLTVVGSGIFTLTPAAMGITFYVTLENNSPYDLDVATRMWECCETLAEGEVDCSYIKLVGGYKGIISRKETRNMTLFYPNVYVYNRVGHCLVGIWHRNLNGQVKELRTRIYFDTSLRHNNIAPAIAVYYEAERRKVKTCMNIDEDVLDNCNPVDCSRKYNGQRVFYSSIEHRCTPAVKCASNATDGIPDNIYCPDGNVCTVLEPVISEEDIKTMNSGRGVDPDLHRSNEFDFIVCHHGNKSKYTGYCTCDTGWTSQTYQVRPTTLQVHLCTISKSKEEGLHQTIWQEISISFLTFKSYDILLTVGVGVCLLLGTTFSYFYSAFRPVCDNKKSEESKAEVTASWPKSKLRTISDKKACCKKIVKEWLENSRRMCRKNEAKCESYDDGALNESDTSTELDLDDPCVGIEPYPASSHSEIAKELSTSNARETPESIARYRKEDEYCKKCNLIRKPDNGVTWYQGNRTENDTRDNAINKQDLSQNERIFQRNANKSILKDSESSRPSKLSKSNVMFRDNETTRQSPQNERVMRIDASSISKSMAVLTSSTLPSSDSSLPLEDWTDLSCSSFNPSDDDND